MFKVQQTAIVIPCTLRFTWSNSMRMTTAKQQHDVPRVKLTTASNRYITSIVSEVKCPGFYLP